MHPAKEASWLRGNLTVVFHHTMWVLQARFSCWNTRSFNVFRLEKMTLPLCFLAGLGCVRSDDVALHRYPAAPLVLQQEEVWFPKDKEELRPRSGRVGSEHSVDTQDLVNPYWGKKRKTCERWGKGDILCMVTRINDICVGWWPSLTGHLRFMLTKRFRFHCQILCKCAGINQNSGRNVQ